MKTILSTISLVAFFFMITPQVFGASIIDKDTKKMVEEVNAKIEKIYQMQNVQHLDQIKSNKEQNETLQQLSSQIESLQKKNGELETSIVELQRQTRHLTKVAEERVVVAPETSPSTQPTTLAPASVSPSPIVSTTPPPIPVLSVPPSAPAQTIVTSLPPVSKAPVVPHKPTSSFFEMKGALFVPYLISMISVVLMSILFFRVRRSEKMIKSQALKSELEALREDLTSERKTNSKIHLTGDTTKIRLSKQG